METVLFYAAVLIVLMAITALTATIRLRKKMQPILLISLILFEAIILITTGIFALCIVVFR